MAANLQNIRLNLAYELTPDKHQRGKYLCPLCPSGHGGAGSTGAFSIAPDGIHGKCFSCGFYGDIFDLEAAKTGLPLAEATRAVVARYSNELPVESYMKRRALKDFGVIEDQPAEASPSTGSEAQAADFSDYIRRCADQLAGSPGEQYLAGRAFTQETMRRFRLGFDPAYRFLGGVYGAVVMPYNESNAFYEIRTIRDDLQRTHDVPADVQRELFNIKALYQNRPCFVVESALCAMSIEQEGGAAVGLGGIGQTRKLLSTIKQKKPSALLILALDNDDRGRAAQKKLAEDLTAAGISFTEYNVAGPCKDPNELLQRDAAMLRGFISGGYEAAAEFTEELKEKAFKEESERQARTGEGMIEAFLSDVQTRMYEPLPTGITDIDKALDGGFMRQQLVCLGAAPGAGKTALAQWIFEGMAAKGVSCVFLNLEMSRNQILARSLSRFAARNGQRISNVKALRGYDWTDDQRAAIMAAAEEYKRTVAPRMIYNPDEVTSNLDSILEYIEKEAMRAEAQGNPAPCIVLDYLQIITGREREDGVELIKRAVFSLKRFAVEHNTVVFLIMAHNRQSNASGTITMESGRDTSAIEYSGDTQIGLTFTRCLKGWKDEHGIKHDKSKNPDELTEKERQEITLKIVKSRFGGVGRTVNLRFNGETMTYTQVMNDFTVVDEKTPFEDEEGWKPIP